MTEPSDQMPQRIGDAERDQATTYLREALAQGRLDQAEFDERVDAALRARTQADLDPLFRDLPGPRPGQAVAPGPGFTAPPWQSNPTAPGADLSTAAAPTAPARTGNPNRVLDTVAWVAWPVTIMLLFATHWSYWWLIFIPIIISSLAGSRRNGRRGHDRNR